MNWFRRKIKIKSTKTKEGPFSRMWAESKNHQEPTAHERRPLGVVFIPQASDFLVSLKVEAEDLIREP